MPQVQRPPHIEENDPRQFSISSSEIKAYKETVLKDGLSSDKMFIRGTASSTVKDRQSDILDEQCQASMLASAKGLTMWLNHKYSVPEDILGFVSDAMLVNREQPDGSSVLDLDIVVQVDEENPRAVKSWKNINNGTRLAFSIGGIFKDFDFLDEDEGYWGGLKVHDLELLEISLVGIPANPRAYTKSQNFLTEMTKGVKAKAKEILSSGHDLAFAKSFILNDSVEEVEEQAAVEVEESPAVVEVDPVVEVETPVEETASLEPPTDEEILASVPEIENPIGEFKEVEPLVSTVITEAKDVGVGDPDSVLDQQGGETDMEAQVNAPEEVLDAADGDPVLSEKHAKLAIKSMRAMKRASAPGMHNESMGHLMRAHKAVADMLPEEYSIPSDARLPSDTDHEGEELSVEDIVQKDFSLENKQLKDIQDAIKSLTEQRIALEDGNKSLKAQKEALEKDLAELRATPVGRLSATPAGSHLKGSETEPVAPIENFFESTDTLSKRMGRKLAGG